MSKNFISNKKETPRMFENDILEFFSKVHPSIPAIIFVPVIAFLFYKATLTGLSALTIFLLVLAGFIAWQMSEYTIHRFLFHFEFDSAFGKRIHFLIHGVHHDYPSDPFRLVLPPSVSIPLAVLFYFVFLVLLGEVYFYPFYTGYVGGYLFYDMTHYAIHHFRIKNKFWLAIKNHHMKHHFQTDKAGFAISLPWFDKFFGSDFNQLEKKG